MINLTINGSEKVEIKETKKKFRWDLVLTALSIYTLTKISLKHEVEITELKKVIEEMKSKGE